MTVAFDALSGHGFSHADKTGMVDGFSR